MSRLLEVSQVAEAPSASAVMAYLRAQGWQNVTTGPKWSVFKRMLDSETVEIEVPLLEEAPDYPRRIAELLWNLEQVERRPAHRILRDLRASTTDVVRIAVDGATATEDGRIGMESGARLFNQTRDLLLASAYATLEKRAVQAGRKPERVMEYLRKVRLGPTEAGSFIITIESPVSPKLQQTPDPTEDPYPPFERSVVLTMAQSLSAVRTALSDTAASGSITPFLQSVHAGVSANLCDAVAGLLADGEAQVLSVAFQFAPARPVPSEVPRRVQFSADSVQLLRDVSQALREQSPITDFTLVGPVRELRSADPLRGGTVTVVALVEGSLRRVRIELGPEEYRIATEAHRDRAISRCEGELVREGRSLTLKTPRHFSIAREE